LTGVNNATWTGPLRNNDAYYAVETHGLNDPAAIWTNYVGGADNLIIKSGTINFNVTSAYEISGGTINGNVNNVVQNFSGGTINGNVSGDLRLTGNPVFNGSLTNVRELRIYTGATLTKAISSWASGALIELYGGTFNPASVATANLGIFRLYAGTMGFNIFTSAYTSLFSVTLFGGTLSFSGDIQVGAPGRRGSLFINSSSNFYGPQFTGTNKNITAYGGSSGFTDINFGSSSPVIDAGTYTGVLTFLPFTGTAPALYQVRGGTYTPPIQTLPLINVAYSTGKGINPTLIYQNYGFATFTQRVAISGSSDILQSELA
jgi:hypothetical protein